MGGFGSGRRASRGKDCTDDVQALDVRRLQRDGLLEPGSAFRWQWSRRGEVVASIHIRVQAGAVTLGYRQRSRSGGWQDMAYPVRLDWTPCHFGGDRAWWQCPAVGCGRRVALLYSGAVFACRRCHDLAYRSQRESNADRSARKADKLRERLQWEPGILNGNGGKPKGMHWKTYFRLYDAHNNAAEAMLRGYEVLTGRLQERLAAIDAKGWR